MKKILSYATYVLGIVVAMGSMANVSAEESKTQTIPLDHIWAYDQPGTQDVRELEPKADPTLSIDELTRRLDVWKILKILKRRPTANEKAGKAFVVLGTGKEALNNAASVFTGKADRRKIVPVGTDVTIVFYAHICGRYVRIRNVEQTKQQVLIKYQFVAHYTTNMSTHFALIPIGKLPEETYQVRIEQLEPIDETCKAVRPIDGPERLISDSFSFQTKKEK